MSANMQSCSASKSALATCSRLELRPCDVRCSPSASRRSVQKVFTRKMKANLSKGRTLRALPTSSSLLNIFDFAAIPAWIVGTLARGMSPKDAIDCGQGRYVDPQAQACVHTCKTGYDWDSKLKACVLEAPETLYPTKVYRQPAISVEVPGTNAETSGSLISRKFLFPESCPVGYYLVPGNNECVPLCAPGFVYDTQLKSCVSGIDKAGF